MAQRITHIFILALLYAISGKLGFMVATDSEFATVIWPPSGIALGIMLVWGYRVWPGVLLGSMLINFTLTGADISLDALFSSKGATAVLTGLGATLQAIVQTFLILKIFSFPVRIERGRDALLFLLIAGPLCCVISASVGALAYHVVFQSAHITPWMTWMTWWVGDTFGVIAFMPLVIIVFSRFLQGLKERSRDVPLSTASCIAVVLSISMTLVAWKVMTLYITEKNRNTFSDLMHETEKSFLYRLDAYGNGLLGAASFFAGSQYVDHEEWKSFVDSMRIDKNYSGMNGIGYIRPVAIEDVDAYIAQMRKEGRTDFSIKPYLNADTFFVIQYIEPLKDNKAAVGLNIAFEKNRFDAAVHAIDTGRPTITRPIVLVQDDQRLPGFLLLHPIYEPGKPINTVEERRASFRGWIYAPFIAYSFLKSFLADDGTASGLFFTIYDGAEKNHNDLIYAPPPPEKSYKPKYREEKTVDVLEQKWTFVWESTPELEARLRSGEPFIILFSGMIFTSLLSMFLLVISQRADVIRREVERKTHQVVSSESKMRMLIRHTPAAVAMFDTHMRYIMTSERWIRDYNLYGKEIIGHTHYEVFPEINSIPEWKEHHQRTLAGESLSREEDSWQRSDGRTEWVRWALHPWRDADDKIGGIVMFTEVITDSKNSKSELLRSNAALEEFAYVVSHDLKAPLRHISMCSSFVKNNLAGKLDEETEKMLNIMQDSSDKMRGMIDSLLDYSRIGRSSGDYRLIDLNKVLADVLVNLTPHIEASNALVQSDNLPVVRGAESELGRVFQNLIENAIKYHQGGKAPVVRIKAQKTENGMWQISVIDNGIGIDEKFSAKIFQLFQRLHGEDSEYVGAGIGLAVCQRIIHYHGGQIWLDQDRKEGSSFSFTLPDVKGKTVSGAGGAYGQAKK